MSFVSADHATVAKDGDDIGDAQQLFEPMRDVDDGDAVGGEVALGFEEDGDFGRRQR